MDVSVIIVNYNTERLLRNCLKSISDMTKGVVYEVIVVDNNSSDTSVSMIRRDFPFVKLIESTKNLGFGRANNLGALKASGSFLFFLNSDTELRNDTISILHTYMREHTDCGIAGGNLVDVNGTPIHSYSMRLPSEWTELERFCPKLSLRLQGKNAFYNHSGKVIDVGYITGADLMISNALFKSAGGFDPDFFMYYEETELTSRIRNLGYSARCVPDAVITHIKGASLEFIDDVKSIVYESKYRYLGKVRGTGSISRAHAFFSLYCSFKRLAFSLLGKKERVAKYKMMMSIDREKYLEQREKRS